MKAAANSYDRRTRRRRPSWLAGVVWAASSGCGDEPAPATPDPSSDTTAASSEDAGSTSAASSSGGAMFTATAMTDADGTTTGPPGVPMLVFPAGANLDFGEHELDDGQIIAIEVVNIGFGAAQALAPVEPLPDGFAFTGGAYPGELGNCSDVLASMEMCIVHVEFNPLGLGAASGVLALDYAGPEEAQQVALEVLGTGVGTTNNLVVDGGFEACPADTAPRGWDQRGDHFLCGTMAAGRSPWEGESLLSTPVASTGPVSIATTIDLSAHAPALATGEVTASAALWTQRLSEDDIAISLRYLDVDGETVAQVDPQMLQSPRWTEWSDERVLPTNATGARLELSCAANSVACAVSLDAVGVTLTYDGP